MEADSPLINARNSWLSDNPSLQTTRLSSLYEVGVTFEPFRFVFGLIGRTAGGSTPGC